MKPGIRLSKRNSHGQAGMPVQTRLRVGMVEVLQQRLNDLKGEYAFGQQRITELQGVEEGIRVKLCRLEGAIQFVEDELKNPAG